MSIRRFFAVMAVAALVLALGVACGESHSDNRAGRASADANDKPFEWEVIFASSRRTIKVGGGVDFCEGDPRPRIARPEIEYRGKDVYIQLKLKTPRTRPSTHERCAGSVLLVTRRITLRRDLSDLKLYDSGVEPPELRWPR